MAARLPIVAAVALALPAADAAAARDDETGIVVQDLAYGEVLFEFFQEDYFAALTRLLAAQQRGELTHHAAEAELMLGGLYLSYGQHRLAGEIFERVLAQSVDPALNDRAWFFLAKIWQQRGYLARGRGGADAHPRRAPRGARARAADAPRAGAHGAGPIRGRAGRARGVAPARATRGSATRSTTSAYRSCGSARSRPARACSTRSGSSIPRTPRSTRCATRRTSRSAMRGCRRRGPSRQSRRCNASVSTGRSRTRRCSASAGRTRRPPTTARRSRRGSRCASAACSTRPCRNRCWPCRTRLRSSERTSRPRITTSTRSRRSAARSFGSRPRSRASRTASSSPSCSASARTSPATPRVGTGGSSGFRTPSKAAISTSSSPATAFRKGSRTTAT